MDIANTGPGSAPAAIKTEYSSNPGVPSAPPPKKEESFGTMLNRMSGVEEQKNLYQAGKNQLTKDAYLKMMMEQMKYQDPFNPVKNEQFTQNMAMMSQLEQQMNMNKTLDKMANQNNNSQIAALQLVGKTVVADHAAIHHESGKFTAVEFKLPQDAKDVSVEVLGPSGEVLKTLPVGQRNEGDVLTKWDGTLENGSPAPTGRYSYKVKAVSIDDKEISIPSKVEGKVTGVTNMQGVTFLLVGNQRVALNEIELIKETEPASNMAMPASVPRPADAMAANQPAKPATSSDSNSAGPKLAPNVGVEADVENALRGDDKEPLEKERLNDLMQVMFR